MKYYKIISDNLPENIILNCILSEKEWSNLGIDITDTEYEFEETIKPLKQNISFEELYKPDIRYCKIVAAERIKTSKFLLLTINYGAENKSVVTNLGSKYEPEIFLGKIMPFVLNLEPITINKTLSEGMIMVAEHNGEIAFIESPFNECSILM